jgi:hypothetical protein
VRVSRIGKRLATFGLALGLALGISARALPQSQEKPKVQEVFSNKRAFRIPFNIDPAQQSRYQKIQLVSSKNFGKTWELTDSKPPESPYFTFKADRDGEFWFAIRTIDTKNRVSPPVDAFVEPNMKVIVDTVLPLIDLEAFPRRGSAVKVRWDLIDDRLDLSTLQLEYQVVGTSGWNRVDIRKPGRMGMEAIDPGTSEPVKVRMSVMDRAKNLKTVNLTVPDGKPRNRPVADSGEDSDGDSPPPRGTFASSEADRSGPSPILSGPPALPPIGESGGEPLPQSSPVGTYNPFDSNEPSGSRPARKPAAASAPVETSNPPLLVNSPKFGLRYEVEDAGPNGPAAVELYITTDGGRNWFKRGEDPDRTSPFPVDLGGEGTFGLKLVCKSSANLGDQPPTNGEVPLTIIEVDSSGPVVKLDPIRVVGSKAILTWHSNDPHPLGRSVLISVKADTPESQWQPITPAPIENNGKFTWILPPNCPPRVHFRVDVTDSLGNRGFAETTETGAILVDRTKPRGRITGLDAGLIEGQGPSARPLR